jgi:hypothetical protein
MIQDILLDIFRIHEQIAVEKKMYSTNKKEDTSKCTYKQANAGYNIKMK